MKFSFIIPCYNSEKTITACLQSVILQIKDLPQGRAEIIVVDTSSTDATVKKIKELGIVPLTISLRSRSKAWNTGAFAARGEYICFIDSGTALSPNWLEHVENIIFNKPDYEIIGMPALFLPSKNINLMNTYFFELKTYQTQEHSLFINTKNCVYKKSFFQKLNGFDERLKHYEDLDLSRRSMAFSPIVYLDDNKHSLILNNEISFCELLKKAFHSGKESAFYYLKWSSDDSSFIFVRLLKRGLSIYQFFLHKKKWRLSLLAFLCFFYYCLGVFSSHSRTSKIAKFINQEKKRAG